MEPLISVIVPIYNVEKYLNRCIESIVNQTYKNLEIILVNDGSPDNCPQMCDEWKKKDSRIKVIHKQNGGLSDARNAGLNIAKGEYIGFVDSDDWINKYMYEKLLKSMIKNKADISCGSVEMIGEEVSNKKILTKKINKVLTNEEAMKSIIIEDYLKQPVWYKLYRASVINNLFFKVGKINEDNFWSYQAIANAKRVSLISDTVYYYVQHQGSIMHETYSLKRLDALEAKFERNNFLKIKYPKLYSFGCENLFNACIYSIQMSLKYLKNEEKRTAITITKKYLKNVPTNFIQYKSIKNKIWLEMYKINVIGTCKLRNFLKIGF